MDDMGDGADMHRDWLEMAEDCEETGVEMHLKFKSPQNWAYGTRWSSIAKKMSPGDTIQLNGDSLAWTMIMVRNLVRAILRAGFNAGYRKIVRSPGCHIVEVWKGHGQMKKDDPRFKEPSLRDRGK